MHFLRFQIYETVVQQERSICIIKHTAAGGSIKKSNEGVRFQSRPRSWPSNHTTFVIRSLVGQSVRSHCKLPFFICSLFFFLFFIFFFYKVLSFVSLPIYPSFIFHALLKGRRWHWFFFFILNFFLSSFFFYYVEGHVVNRYRLIRQAFRPCQLQSQNTKRQNIVQWENGLVETAHVINSRLKIIIAIRGTWRLQTFDVTISGYILLFFFLSGKKLLMPITISRTIISTYFFFFFFMILSINLNPRRGKNLL